MSSGGDHDPTRDVSRDASRDASRDVSGDLPGGSSLGAPDGARSATGPSPAPAMLRHEGPLRVSVPEGGHSALSSTGHISTGRLRPAVGPAGPSLGGGAPGLGGGVGLRRLRSPLAPGLSPSAPAPAGPSRRRFVFTPEAAPDAADRERVATELQRRLERLAQTNLDVSRQVSTLEAQLEQAAPPHRSGT